MSMTFYYCAPMSSSTRAHWALEELGLSCEKRRVNLAEKEQRTPEFLALNPNGKVPLLVVDGTPIFESLGILLYLADAYGVEKGIYPPPGLQRGEVFKWMAWSTATLGTSLTVLALNLTNYRPVEERNELAAANAKREIFEQVGVLDMVLDGKEYLVGNKFSFADISNTITLTFMSLFNMDISEYKNVTAWIERCHSRPAFLRAKAG